MVIVKITITGYRCERCQHEWVPRGARNTEPKKGKKGEEPKPRICPKCKSAWWDVPPTK
jgi:hypothetical protein